MASSYKDSSPNAGAKGKGGMKNEDGREGGASWNSSKSKEKFSDKSVGNQPNEGAHELPKKGVVGKVID